MECQKMLYTDSKHLRNVKHELLGKHAEVKIQGRLSYIFIKAHKYKGTAICR